MKHSSQYAEIIQYVTKHPGCYMSDIRRDTSIQKGAIASALTELTRVKTLRREGFEKRYRYFVVRPEDRPAVAPKRTPKQPNRDTANPLNNLSISAWQQSGAGEQKYEQRKSRMDH